jgi:GntR family transcriptional regulator
MNNLSQAIEVNSDQINLNEIESMNFTGVIPYYYQVQKYIEEKINSHKWNHGQKLPSEQELCTFFKVSRTVIRQALHELATAGYIITHKGKGSFVTIPKLAWGLMENLSGFYEDAIAKGQTVQTKVLELKVIPASGEIAQMLHLNEQENVIKLHRLRFLDGEPVLVVTTYIPEKLCPDLIKEDFSDKSLYRVLRDKYQLVTTEGIRTIESINASHDLAEMLRIKTGAAVSLLKSVGFMANGIPLEYYYAWHRGDRSRFIVKLTTKSI